MITSRQDFIRLAVIVILWYLGLTYLPQIIGTCMDGDCGFSPGEIVVSVAIPLAFFAVTIALEMIPYRKSLLTALSDIGVTRFHWAGLRPAVIYLLPLIVFYPLYALATSTTLALKPNWQWFVLSAALINGLVEESMMRGYVFRHLRAGRTFWRGAALSTAYFAGYHLPLIVTAGPLIGVAGVITALPLGFLTAYTYEKGNNTVWSPALLHAVNNGLAYIFAFTADVQPIASALYLMVGIITATLLLVSAYRSGYGREST